VPALGSSEDGPNALGRYELVTPIGRGGMAEVHLAVQRGPAGFEKLVVIKVVHEQLASQPKFVEMLLDEAKLAALIKHPNVVDIYDLGEEAGRYFIAMEYLEGEPLLDVLRAGGAGNRLDPLSTARVIADAAEGLDAAHRLKARDGRPLELVHHDVSLGNIVVLYSGLVKLLDFGVAKARSASAGARVHGKLGYMAPEKLADRGVDRRSDIWSLGCVLWEALTLQRLFEGGEDAETVRRVREQEVVPPSKLAPAVPPELDAVVLRALERDPERRYQTAKALAADLEEVLRERKYGAKNDRIAAHMESVFAARVAARERVLVDIAGRRRPSAETLEAAFGDPLAGVAAMAAPARPSSPVPGPDNNNEDNEDDEDNEANESTGESTLKTAPNPPEWKPAEATATPTPLPVTPTVPLAALTPPAPAPIVAGPPPVPAPPVLPSGPPAPPAFRPMPRRPDEPNPFADDEDQQTVADIIPSSPEASRSLQSEPTWMVARQGTAIEELQRWVQENRTPPKTRREALARAWRDLDARVAAWAIRRRVPRWSPYAAAGVVVLALIVLILR
jgi:serine/threonine-protein kinase